MKSHKGEETRELFNPSGNRSTLEAENELAQETMKMHSFSKKPEINHLEELREKWCIKKL